MLNKEFSFELIAQNDGARLGKIKTSRGFIDTPSFMPVGTQGTSSTSVSEDLIKNRCSNYFRQYLSFTVETRD